MSKYEDYINSIIVKKIKSSNNYSYRREIEFNDLKRKQKLRFDFGIYEKNQLIYLIEVDGEQHFFYNNFFHKTKKDFTKQQEYDRIKNSYCLAHNIPLYRIPYSKINSIKHFSDIIQPQYKVNSKWHNDLINL